MADFVKYIPTSFQILNNDMLLHRMKLNPGPFKKIKDGEKVIEIRLNDEKRQLLKVGDEIEFRLISDETEILKTKVLDLSVFSTFKEMFLAFSPEEYGSKSQDEYEGMYQVYSPENEKKYGVLAIRIQYISAQKSSNFVPEPQQTKNV